MDLLILQMSPTWWCFVYLSFYPPAHVGWAHVAWSFSNIGIALTSLLPQIVFQVLSCSECQHALLCLTHYTSALTPIWVPTQMLFFLRKVYHLPHLQSRRDCIAWMLHCDSHITLPNLGPPPQIIFWFAITLHVLKCCTEFFQHKSTSSNRATTDFVFQRLENCHTLTAWEQQLRLLDGTKSTGQTEELRF